MSSRSKGAKNEREFESILQQIGYTTQRVKGSTRFNKNVDFWGLWDIISFNQRNWLLVQVKTDYRDKVYKELRDWFEKHKPPNTCCIYAIRKKGKRAGDRWEVAYVGQSTPTTILPIKVKSINIKRDGGKHEHNF